jgi:hypothetical protein
LEIWISDEDLPRVIGPLHRIARARGGRSNRRAPERNLLSIAVNNQAAERM